MSLDFRAQQLAFAAHLRDPSGYAAPAAAEARRVAIYRDLFYNNVASLLASNFPVIRALLADAEWHALVRAFYAGHRAHTPLFPEIGRELVRYLESRDAAGDPPFLPELAHYEWAELAVSIDEAALDEVPHDRDGDLATGVPVLSPLAWPLLYRWPVHRIRADFRPTEPPAAPTCLIVSRNRADEVGFFEATPVILRMVELMQESARTGLEVAQALARELGAAGDASLIAACLECLATLKARDIVLGTRP